MTMDEMERRVLAQARSQLSLSIGAQARHEAKLLETLMPTSLAPPALPNRRHGTATSMLRALQPNGGKWLIIGLIAGGAVGAGVTWGVLGTPSELVPAPASEAASSGAPVLAADAASSLRHASVAREPSVTQLPEPGTAPTTEVAERPARRWVRPHRGRPVDESAAALELAMLQRARRALNRDSAAQALGIVTELDERFPNGVLLEERAALRVLALCAVGDLTAARGATARFLERHPGSMYVPRVRAACALEGSSRTK